MARFKDAEGREWNLKVTCLVLSNFEDRTGIALLEQVHVIYSELKSKVKEGESIKFKPEDLIVALEKLFKGKLKNLLTASYCALEKEALARNVSYQAFVDGIGGSGLKDLLAATVEAYMDFFQLTMTRPPAPVIVEKPAP